MEITNISKLNPNYFNRITDKSGEQSKSAIVSYIHNHLWENELKITNFKQNTDELNRYNMIQLEFISATEYENKYVLVVKSDSHLDYLDINSANNPQRRIKLPQSNVKGHLLQHIPNSNLFIKANSTM